MDEKEVIQHKEEKDILNNIKNIDFGKVKEIRDVIIEFFKQKNNSGKVILGVASISFVLVIYLSISLYSKINKLDAQASNLSKLTQYDVDSLKTNPNTREILNFSNSIKDLIDKNDDIKQSIQKYNKYVQDLHLPYQNLLKNIYLPSLNIWKNQYSNKIDTSLIGGNFLKNNPYNDVVLLQKWSDFFMNVGNGEESNDISNVSVGDIVQTPDGYFYIPVTVSFVAKSKRSFMMLIDKLSNTSNKDNIAAFNEFFYYLRQEIKKSKQSEVDAIVSKYSDELGSGLDQDAYIGYALYNWILNVNSGENTLIDAKILDSTIKSLMICDNIDDDQCYYNFREKYRDVSVFAYAISKDINIDVVEGFKKFFTSMPPIISIKDFTFDKVKSQDLSSFATAKYKGNVTIDVYGRGISQGEIDQIATVLGKKCRIKESPISIEEAISLVQDAILKQSDVVGSDKSKVDALWELQGVLDNINKEFGGLSNYKKIIRLFEIYRMLDDSGLCQ